jgi:integrase/recombinase XerD
LDDPTVPEEDKLKIRDLLNRPWNLYIRRHTAATEISKKLKDSVLIDQYMGWSHAGNTRQKYQHYYSDDGIDAMLLADGLPVASVNGKGTTKKKDLLKPKQCPNCNESNNPDSKFCTKCKFVLSFDAFNEVTNEAEETKKKLTELEIQQQERFNRIQEMQEEFANLRHITLNLYAKLGVEAPKNDNEIIKLPQPIANLETDMHRLRSEKKGEKKKDLMIY